MTVESFATQAIQQKIAYFITHSPRRFDRRADLVTVTVTRSMWRYVQTLLDVNHTTTKPIFGFTFTFTYSRRSRMWVGIGKHWSFKGSTHTETAYSVRDGATSTRNWADPKDAWEEAAELGMDPVKSYLVTREVEVA